MTDRPLDWRHARQEHEALLRYWSSDVGVYQGALSLHLGRDFARMRSAMAEGADPVDVAMASPRYKDMTPEQRGALLAPIAAEAWSQLKDAPTWYVESEMATLVAHASLSMPSEPILHSDLPGPSGFLYLADPLWLSTREDGVATLVPVGDEDVPEIPHRAFHWHSTATGVDVVCYRARGEYATTEEPLTVDEEQEMPSLTAAMEFTWRFGDESWNDDLPQVARFLKALWTISKQTIATTSTPVLPRPERRRAERLSMRTDVVVVALRRAKRPTHEDQHARPVEWTHRWLVSGHWRNQYLPSSDAHRLQWISDHVKGPDDKPFVPKPRIFNVTR